MQLRARAYDAAPAERLVGGRRGRASLGKAESGAASILRSRMGMMKPSMKAQARRTLIAERIAVGMHLPQSQGPAPIDRFRDQRQRNSTSCYRLPHTSGRDRRLVCLIFPTRNGRRRRIPVLTVINRQSSCFIRTTKHSDQYTSKPSPESMSIKNSAT